MVFKRICCHGIGLKFIDLMSERENKMHRKDYHTRNKQEHTMHDKTIAEQHSSNEKGSLVALQRKIQKLERTLAQRETEVWNLRHLILYR